MFLSKDDLKLAYGVDLDIAKFYVDRRVPENNLYWKIRKLYMVPQSGYIFIPIYADLMYRIGIPKKELLSENHVLLMEAIMHSAAKQEAGEITFREHIGECIDVAEKSSRNPDFLDQIKQYFNRSDAAPTIKFGTRFPSLNRADTYLLSLAAIPFNPETAEKLVEAWYALMTYFLITDDLVDIKEDFINKEDNVLIDAGLTEEGAVIITDMINHSHDVMMKYNPVMANRIDHKRHYINVASIIESFLKEKDPVNKK